MEFAATHHGRVVQTGADFEVAAEVDGESAKDLNRNLLSALRRVERRTRLHARWRHGNEVEHFFDYVAKKKETVS